MASKAHRACGAVAYKEVQRHRVAILQVRIVTAFTFNISIDKNDLAKGILSLPLCYQTFHEIRLVLNSVKAERVRVQQVGAKNIARVHLALHFDLTVGHSLANSNGSIMATQAKAARASRPRLFHRLFCGCGTPV